MRVIMVDGAGIEKPKMNLRIMPQCKNFRLRARFLPSA